MSFGEAMGLGGSVTLIGVMIVFSALVCLIFITWLYPKISLGLIAKSSDAKKRRVERKAARKAAAKTEQVTEAPAKPAVTKTEDDSALIAVITAAIAASLGAQSNGIVIKSLRRSASNVSSWGREARNEQVYNRF